MHAVVGRYAPYYIEPVSSIRYNDLNSPENKISVHVLCPAIVDTNITKSGRNRQAAFSNETTPEAAKVLASVAVSSLVHTIYAQLHLHPSHTGVPR